MKQIMLEDGQAILSDRNSRCAIWIDRWRYGFRLYGTHEPHKMQELKIACVIKNKTYPYIHRDAWVQLK